MSDQLAEESGKPHSNAGVISEVVLELDESYLKLAELGDKNDLDTIIVEVVPPCNNLRDNQSEEVNSEHNNLFTYRASLNSHLEVNNDEDVNKSSVLYNSSNSQLISEVYSADSTVSKPTILNPLISPSSINIIKCQPNPANSLNGLVGNFNSDVSKLKSKSYSSIILVKSDRNYLNSDTIIVNDKQELILSDNNIMVSEANQRLSDSNFVKSEGNSSKLGKFLKKFNPLVTTPDSNIVVPNNLIQEALVVNMKSPSEGDLMQEKLDLEPSPAEVQQCGRVLRTKRYLPKRYEHGASPPGPRRRRLESSVEEASSPESEVDDTGQISLVSSKTDLSTTQPDVSTLETGNLTKKGCSKKYACKVEGCSAVFYRPGRLSEHQSTHSGEKPFHCSVVSCNKAYSNLAHLKRHNLQAHKHSPGPTPFICRMEGCGQTLKTRDTLMKHVRRAHAEKLFSCSICSVAFETSTKLADHSKKKHNNKESHHCVKCNVSFSRLGKYNRHMRRHRLHICPKPGCYFSAENYNIVRSHISASHPMFLECHYCGKQIKDKAQLRRHCRFHLSKAGLADPLPEKPFTEFQCSECSSVLSTKGSLKRHVIAIHKTTRTPRKIKTGTEREPRWDKGVPRKSIASLLASTTVPASLEFALLTKEKHSCNDSTSDQVKQLILDNCEEDKSSMEHGSAISKQMDVSSNHPSSSPIKLN